MTIPHRVIIKTFFWPYSAEQIASGLRTLYRSNITAARVKDIWIEESAWNPLLQVDRPKGGFPRTEETKLMESLAA